MASKQEHSKQPEDTRKERTAQQPHNCHNSMLKIICFSLDLALGGGETAPRQIPSLASEPDMASCLQEGAPHSCTPHPTPPFLLCQAAPGLWPHLPHPVTPMIPTVASKHNTITNLKTKGRNSSQTRFQLPSAELLQHCLLLPAFCFPNPS